MTEEFLEDGIYSDAEEVVEPEEEQEAIEGELDEDESQDQEESEQPKKKTGFVEFDTPEQKARVAQLTREKHENERKYKQAMQELSRFKQSAIVAPKEVPAPTADPVTEQEEYVRQQRAREQYIAEQVRYDDAKKSHQEAEVQIKTQRSQELAKNYVDNAAKLKINPKVLEQAGKVCETFGIHENSELTEFLLEDPQGAAIVVHLGNNLEQLAEVAGMSAVKAVAYIERNVRSGLAAKQTSKAPAPPTKVGSSRGKSSSSDGWEVS